MLAYKAMSILSSHALILEIWRCQNLWELTRSSLMAGPGAISLVIIHAHQATSLQGKLLLGGSIFSVALISLISLYLAEPIGKALGVTGLNIATRIMGLILASIGVQMIAQGLIKLLPGLAG